MISEKLSRLFPKTALRKTFKCKEFLDFLIKYFGLKMIINSWYRIAN